MGILRTMLALAVVIYHSFTIFGLRMTGGQVSVQAFYIISGFYMALILNEKYKSIHNYWLFIKARLLRIYPTYALVLGLAFLISWIAQVYFSKPLYFHKYVQSGHTLSDTTWLYFIIENLIILGQDLFIFLKVNAIGQLQFVKYPLSESVLGFHHMLVPQAWSISIEMYFYLLAPFLLRLNVKMQMTLVLLLFAMRIYLMQKYFLYLDPWTYRFFPFELVFFIIGSVSYHFYNYMKPRIEGTYIGYALLAILVFCIIFYHEIWPNNVVKMYLFYSLIIVSMPFIFIAFKDLKFDRWIGELSFSIYISHHLIVTLLHDFFFKHAIYMKYYGYTTILLSLILALVIHHFLVRPMEMRRQRMVQANIKD